MSTIRYLTGFVLLLVQMSCGPVDGPESNYDPTDYEPEQDALLAYGKDEWPISCYFYDPNSKNYGQNLPIFNQAWVWARTPEGAHIHAKGNIDEGFLRADGIYYSKGKSVAGKWIDGPGAELVSPTVTTTDQMEKICQDSIDRYHKGKGYKLIGMVGSRNTRVVTNFIDNAYPLTVGEKKGDARITRLVIFGDSLSDTGRLKKWTQIMPDRPFFLGRFSNGGTWSDYLSKMADVSVLNYSMGGAVTKPNITSTLASIKRYVAEVGRYFITSSLRNFINEYRDGELKNKKIAEADRTLYVIWGGANDFLSKFDVKAELNSFIDDPERPGVGANSVIDQTILNVSQEVRGLVSLGAKNIMVANLPDVGTTPRMTEKTEFRKGTDQDRYDFAVALSGYIAKYNDALAKKIIELKVANPTVKIVLFDAAKALKQLMDGQGPNGEPNFDWGIDLTKSFTKLSAPGKPDIRVGVKCYLGGYTGSKKDSDICPNASTMLFWDEVHPTAVGHCGLAFIMNYQLYRAGILTEQPSWKEYQQTCKGG